MQRIHVILLCLVLLLAGCGSGASSAVAPTAPPLPPTAPVAAPTAGPAATSPAAAPAPGATADPAALSVRLEPVSTGFDNPVHVTGAGDGSERLFVVEQRGVISIVRGGQRLAQPFLDITPLVGSSGTEQGLLSVAFHPDYQRNGLFFVNYTDRNGDTVVARYRVSANPDEADSNSAATLLTIDQPAANHNGGLLKFGPDGYLYIGMGDGGRAGDPWGNAQNRDVLLGKLLRLDVDSAQPYATPADNPFVGQAGARPEIWAYGLRNPWRFSFDRSTGDLYIADVGQNAYEEVHFTPADSTGGENYGWNIMEGAACYPASQDCDQNGLQQPVVTYGRSDGCSITGGYVYRGSAFPQMAGLYVYGDYCSGNIWALHQADGTWQNARIAQTDLNISSFGEDDTGEIYLTDRDGGVLYRLVVA